MIDATLIADLIKAGLAPELVGRVANAIVSAKSTESPVDTAAERRRAWDRERKRQTREQRLSDSEWIPLMQSIIERDENHCKYCGSGDRLTADHVIPMSRGGTHDPSNLVACCIPCNTKKGNKLLSEWQANAANIHPTVHPNPPDTDSALSSSAPPPTQVSKEVKKERARGHRIPPDWKPTAEHYQQAGDDMRRDRRWVDQRATDMRIWAETNHHRAVARKSDWDLTFTGWMRREAGNNRGANDESKSVLAAADRQIERFGGMEAARAYVPGSSGPEPLSLDFGSSAPSLRVIPKG